MPFEFLQIDHLEPSPVLGQSTVFARARYRDPATLQEVTQEFMFPDLTSAQENAQRYAEAYLPVVNGIDLALAHAAPAPMRVISKVEFLRRFGDANMVAVLAAAKQSPAVDAWVFWFSSAVEIALDDEPKVAEGIQALIDAGLVDVDTLARVTA